MMKFAKTTGALTVLGWVTLLNAQPSPPPPPQLGVETMTVRAAEVKTQVDVDYRHVLHLQSVARRGKDVIRLTCVNDKMVTLKAQSNLFDTADQRLQHALAGSTEDRFAAYADVTEIGTRIHNIRSEADRCAGEAELENTETGNSFEPPPIVDDPTNTNPFDQGGGVEPPGYASPWR
jgi:hypothetical protein